MKKNALIVIGGVLAAQAICAQTSIYSNAIVALQPVAYWRLNETAPSPVPNVASNASSLGQAGDGFVVPDALVGEPGIVGKAVRLFNTNNDANYCGSKIDVPYNAALNPNPPFTIEFWAKPASLGSDPIAGFCPLSSFNPYFSPANRAGWLFYVNDSGRWQFRIGSTNGYIATATAVTNNATVGTWQHIVGVFDGSNATLYVNGQRAGSATASGAFTLNQWTGLRIGGTFFNFGSSRGTRGFDGWVDEVCAYGSALGSNTIAAHFSAATTNNTAYTTQILSDNPVGYWRLDEPHYITPGPDTFPTAANSGTAGAAANGTNTLGLIEGQTGVPYAQMGANNQACQFNGEVGYFALGNPPALSNLFGKITLMAWIKPTVRDGIRDIIAHGAGSGPEVFLRIGNILGAGAPNTAYYEVGASTATNYISASAPVPDTDMGAWVFLVGTWDGANWNLYRNGSLIASAADAVGAIAVTNRWAVGSASDADDAYGFRFCGSIDEPAIFTNALSLDDIALLASQTNGPGAALFFNGTNSYVSIATTGSLTGTFTVELWANPRHPTNILTLVSSRGTVIDFGFDFKFMQGNLIHGDIGNGNSWITTGADAAYSYSTGVWYHIAYVVTPTNYTIYVNGVENGVGIFASNNPVLYDSTHHLIIGSVAGTAEYMDGLIDEVRIWNTARSASDIQATIYRNLLGSETGLMGYWRFDEGSGATTTDASGHGFTAFLTNSPGWVASTAPVGALEAHTAPASSLTGRSAVLNGTILVNFQPARAWFEYGFSTNYANSTLATDIPSPNATTVAVSSQIQWLFPGFVYHFRLVATNISGASYGPDQMFSGLPDAAYPIPYTFSTFAGAAGTGFADGIGRTAQFSESSEVALDTNGNVFVADGQTVRKMTPASVVTTIAGFPGSWGFADGTNSAARFGYLEGIAADSAGNFFVADGYASTIRKIAPSGTNWVVTTIAGLAGSHGSNDGTNADARFDYPVGITLDRAGSLYVVDNFNYTIRKITPVGSNWVVATIAGSAGSPGHADGTSGSAQFYAATGIAMGPDTNLYVTDLSENANTGLRKITPIGSNWVVSTIADLPGVAGHIAMDANNNLYVTDGLQAIRKIAPGGVVSVFAGSPRVRGFADGVGTNALFYAPWGIALSTAGNLYVSDFSSIRLVTSAGLVRTLAGAGIASGSADGTGQSARFNQPAGIAVDAGNVYVADTKNDTIRQITSAGVVSTLAGLATNPGSADGVGDQARFYAPQGIEVDSTGNVYVADTGNNTIRKITPAGVVSTLAGLAGTTNLVDGFGASARFNSPVGIAVDDAGNLYVADQGNNVIRVVYPTGWVATIAGNGVAGGSDGTGSDARFDAPSGVAVDSANNLYIADAGGETIRKMTPLGGYWIVTTIAGQYTQSGSANGLGIAARFAMPWGIAVDSSTNVFVTEPGNFTVRKLTQSGTNWAVTTLAGLAGFWGSADGTGSEARFGSVYILPPSVGGVAVDGSGFLYVADTFNNTIRKAYFSRFYPTNPVPYTLPPINSQLTMTLLPEEAVAAGAKWRFPWEFGWRDSGAVVSNLVPGNYEIEFRAAPGWVAPSNDIVAVAANGSNSPVYTYFEIIGSDPNASPGSLTVNLGSSAPSAARWGFLGEQPYDFTNNFSTNLPPGTYLIGFKPVAGYQTPPNLEVQLAAGQNFDIPAKYLLAQTNGPGVELPVPVPPASISNLTDFPYGFNGQLQSEVGYGSGVAVDANVVLTVAHVVFNDQTLSYANEVWWFLRKTPGVINAPPLRARGAYVLSGYAAQRMFDLTNGVAADQSTPQSRNLDVAALYFPFPVAGGGYGGYLPSDASPNPWLTGTSSKLLVGYPVDGSMFGDTSITSGAMYETGPQPYPLALAPEPIPNQQVYVAPWFLSYPGNSGGPLYVQYNGYYYPAGVYLGTLYNGAVPFASAVRAIDSQVVNLITNAATLGDSGTNGTGGGVIIISSSSSGTPNLAYLRVELGPAAARAAGAAWKIPGRPFDGNAIDTVVFYTNGTLGLQLNTNVPGWEIASSTNVALVLGQITMVSVQYGQPTNPPPLLTLGPAGLDFGQVVLGQTNTLSFQVTNSGSQTLTCSVSTTLPFRLATGALLSLAPAQTGLVSIGFAPTNASNFSSSVIFTSNGGNSTNAVRGSGVLPAPPALSFVPGTGLGITGPTGTTFVLDYRTSLSAAVWLPLKTSALGPGFTLLLPWPPTNGPAAFYRARWVP